MTAQSLRAQGEANLIAGFANLDHHIRALRGYGVPIVVAINRFPADLPADLNVIVAECDGQDVACPSRKPSARGPGVHRTGRRGCCDH